MMGASSANPEVSWMKPLSNKITNVGRPIVLRNFEFLSSRLGFHLPAKTYRSHIDVPFMSLSHKDQQTGDGLFRANPFNGGSCR